MRHLPELAHGSERLPVPLTDLEWREAAESAAAFVREIIDLEEAKKAASKQYSDEINDRKSLLAQVSLEAHTKTRLITTATSTYAVIETNEKITVRRDTNEVIHRTTLTVEEREKALQLPINFGVDRGFDPSAVDEDEETERQAAASRRKRRETAQ